MRSNCWFTATRRLVFLGQNCAGLWDSVIQGNPFFYYGGLVFGRPPLYHRSGFHFPQPWSFFHLVNIYFFVFPCWFKGNLSLLDIFFVFFSPPRGRKRKWRLCD